jgi:hypothetical protein
MSTSFYPRLPQLGDWLQPHSHDSEQKCAHWSADKDRQRLLDFLCSAATLAEEEDDVATVFVADECDVSVTVEAPVKQAEKTLEQRFLEQADIWDRETAYLSSTPKMVLHDSYQTIMAMGPDVVPYLLRDLQISRRSWFWALRHLTHANPVPLEDQGNLDKMIAAWVAWGKREGRI